MKGRNKHIFQKAYKEKPGVLIRLLEYALNDKTIEHVAEKEFGTKTSCPNRKFASDLYSLNEIQKAAFYIATRDCLNSFLHLMRNHGIIPKIKHLLLYLGGEGGTGKCGLIKAIQQVANSWGRPISVRTLAPTGKATCLVNGETLHYFFKFN